MKQTSWPKGMQLGELERHLVIEIKSRNRAEKRLEYALKKLESLKRPNPPDSLASSSEGWKVDSRPAADSSKQCGSQGEEEEVIYGDGLKDLVRDDGLGSSSGDSANRVVSQEGSWSSVGTAHSRNTEGPLIDEKINGRDHQGLIADAVRGPSLNADEPESPPQAKHSDDTLGPVWQERKRRGK